jgi:myosin heavy chain 9/10/11/14
VTNASTNSFFFQRSPPGILALLDEQSVFPNATDETLIRKLHAHFGKAKKHPKYEEPRFSDKSLTFSILHYADVVTYDVTNWLEKNKDPLQPDLETALRESKDSYVRRLFTEYYEDLPTSLAEFQKKGAKGANFVTVAAQYKTQVFVFPTSIVIVLFDQDVSLMNLPFSWRL